MSTRDAWGAWPTDSRAVGLISDHGSVTIVWLKGMRTTGRTVWYRSPSQGRIAGRLGFEWTHYPEIWLLSVPDALPLALTGGLSWWAFRHARRIERVLGSCATCGY